MATAFTTGYNMGNVTNDIYLTSSSGGVSGWLEVSLSALNIILRLVALVTNLAGNAVIIICVHRYRWLQKPVYVTMQMLAVADMSVSANTVNTLVRDMWGGYPARTYLTVQMWFIIGTIASTLHLLLATVERFVAVRFPLFYRRHATMRRARLASLGAWLLALVINSREMVSRHAGRQEDRDPYKLYVTRATMMVASFALFVTLTTILHWQVMRIARRSLAARRRSSACSVSSTTSASSRLGRRALATTTARTVIVVNSVYFLLFTPLVVTRIISIAMKDTDFIPDPITGVCVAVMLFNSSVNVFIYWMWNANMHNAIARLLHFETEEDCIDSI